VFVLCFSLRQSGYNGIYLKDALDRSGTYSQLSNLISKSVDSSLKTNSEANPLKLIGPFIKKEITPDYLQSKLESVINDTEAWVNGSPNPPILSFTDLKEKLLAQNKKIITQLENLEKEYQKNKPQLEAALKEAQAKDPSLAQTSLPDLNISAWLNKDPVIDLKEILGGIKVLHFLAQTGTLILGGLLLFYLFIIILISGYRSLSPVLIISAIWNYLLYLSVNRLLPILVRFLPKEVENFNLPPYIPPSLWTPFTDSLAKISPMASLLLLGLGLGIWLASHLLHPHKD
jgi:hypothetical protein